MRKLLALAAVTAMALAAATEPAAAAERQCGLVSGIFLGDLPSGGTVTIDGRKFLVGGVGPRNVDLSAAGQLSIGSGACAEGDFRVLADGSVDLYNGRIVPNTTGLPSTSTVAATTAAGEIDACGSLSFYSTSNDAQLGLSFDGALHAYRLIGAGTVPEALGARSTALTPERVRLVGRAGTDAGTVTDYTVTRVATCIGLPSTSTERVAPWRVILPAVAALLGLLALSSRARTWLFR